MFSFSFSMELIQKDLNDKSFSLSKGSFEVLEFEKMVKNIKVSNEENIEIDFDQIDLDDDTTLLLCTDGLSNYVSDSEILELTSDKKHYAFADRLVNKANENGGGDNITVVVISK